jgi:hypothetical protein
MVASAGRSTERRRNNSDLPMGGTYRPLSPLSATSFPDNVLMRPESCAWEWLPELIWRKEGTLTVWHRTRKANSDVIMNGC